ncbi:hypothetical protein CASFOL_001889 [Castilleja foliolosa]|uniref:Ubiquitin-like protease family profile domain-containing protein n=1 Tax=Castilleja foliolosa TaxID=1961234 RepID=A0ABD3ECP8_9LAMI
MRSLRREKKPQMIHLRLSNLHLHPLVTSHETWKRARITKSGDYNNEETSFIAAKIDALEQEHPDGMEVSQRELCPSPVVKDTEKDVLKVLWIEAADITKSKNCCIEAGIVSLTRAYVSINQMDIMGLLADGTISVPVMKFYNKCLYNVLVSSGRADKYGLMCLLAIQSHGNNEEMGLIRNRVGEGGFDCFLLPFYGAIETYQVVKGMRSNTLSRPKWVYPKCYNKDVVDPECGLFVMRHMLEIIKLDIANSFEEGGASYG